MKKWVSFFSLAGTLAFAATDSLEWSDSGIHGPKYSQILTQMAQLQSQYADIATVLDYGKSVQGKTLRMLLVMKNNSTSAARPAIIMSGSTHGNEYLNLEDRLPELFLKKSKSNGPVAEYLDQGGVLVLIPILNPDGYDARQRENAHGVDLNRDWDVPPAGFKGFKEIETRALAQRLEALSTQYRLSFRLTVDYHCCVGALLHPWAYKKEKLPAADLAKHAAIGELANRHLGEIEVGATGEVLGYFPMGTTKDYYYDRYGALSFTYEGRYAEENKYLDKHLSWWEDMVGLVSSQWVSPLMSLLPVKARQFFRFAD